MKTEVIARDKTNAVCVVVNERSAMRGDEGCGGVYVGVRIAFDL